MLVTQHTNTSINNNAHFECRYEFEVQTRTFLHNSIDTRRLNTHITCTITKLHISLEINHYKIPFPKVILHPAPQIKLWGGGDFGIFRKNHLPQKTPPKIQHSFLDGCSLYQNKRMSQTKKSIEFIPKNACSFTKAVKSKQSKFRYHTKTFSFSLATKLRKF